MILKHLKGSSRRDLGQWSHPLQILGSMPCSPKNNIYFFNVACQNAHVFKAPFQKKTVTGCFACNKLQFLFVLHAFQCQFRGPSQLFHRLASFATICLFIYIICIYIYIYLLYVHISYIYIFDVLPSTTFGTCSISKNYLSFKHVRESRNHHQNLILLRHNS